MPVLSRFVVGFLLLGAVAGVRPAVAEEESPAAPPAGESVVREMEYQGYLWRDREKRVRIGWTVVAMGVMAMPAYVVEGDLAGKLEPLVSDVRSDHVFWNYQLDAKFRGDKPRGALPRIPDRLAGTVEGPKREAIFGDPSIDLRMTKGRLVSAEFIGDEWLAAWTEWFTGYNVHRAFTEAEERERARRGLAILRKLRAAPGPTEAQRALVEKIDPKAEVVETFRRTTERELLRWVLEVNKRLDLKLGDLEKEFGRLPPSQQDVHEWFMTCETREAFLAKVRAAPAGEPADMRIGWYRREGRSTTMVSSSVAEVETEWTDEEYVERRAITREMFKR